MYNIHSNLKIFNFILQDINLWHNFKILYLIFLFISSFVFGNVIYSKLPTNLFKKQEKEKPLDNNSLHLLIGKSSNGNKIYLPEKSLYQNMLITGGIGTGKTASAMYPFTKQLINYMCNDADNKLGFLILDVKGNYYSKVSHFAKECNRLKDVIVIELNR